MGSNQRWGETDEAYKTRLIRELYEETKRNNELSEILSEQNEKLARRSITATDSDRVSENYDYSYDNSPPTYSTRIPERPLRVQMIEYKIYMKLARQSGNQKEYMSYKKKLKQVKMWRREIYSGYYIKHYFAKRRFRTISTYTLIFWIILFEMAYVSSQDIFLLNFVPAVGLAIGNYYFLKKKCNSILSPNKRYIILGIVFILDSLFVMFHILNWMGCIFLHWFSRYYKQRKEKQQIEETIMRKLNKAVPES
ncbi:hypothetical protein J41TS12_37310 [Paenibacillus antibioticophila]|uniref:Uncharacterized protein n=1 Tax=Paenibacillus antibioticophila TaxID=1274374 RepID=A0A919XYW7_9BACL|nr:hypothetical protein [Paenibacillus antibioticophila]GIO38870.1 hypothetical protein J41TS12_37310 [Paenibacillus antibioticophila]